MPMIDIYAAAGTFADIKKLSTDAAALVKSVEQVPDIPMFRKNTALPSVSTPRQGQFQGQSSKIGDLGRKSEIRKSLCDNS